jgi:hypothetical protein
MPSIDRRHTSKILLDLRNRIVDLCDKNDEPNLADAVWLLYDLASRNPSAVRSERKKMLSILASEDEYWKDAERFLAIAEAMAEREAGTALH